MCGIRIAAGSSHAVRMRCFLHTVNSLLPFVSQACQIHSCESSYRAPIVNGVLIGICLAESSTGVQSPDAARHGTCIYILTIPCIHLWLPYPPLLSHAHVTPELCMPLEIFMKRTCYSPFGFKLRTHMCTCAVRSQGRRQTRPPVRAATCLRAVWAATCLRAAAAGACHRASGAGTDPRA